MVCAFGILNNVDISFFHFFFWGGGGQADEFKQMNLNMQHCAMTMMYNEKMQKGHIAGNPCQPTLLVQENKKRH